MGQLVVVGVDGSSEAAAALAYAAVDAARRGATPCVLSIVDTPGYWSVPPGMIPLAIPQCPVTIDRPTTDTLPPVPAATTAEPAAV
jgi:hypothetical protein